MQRNAWLKPFTLGRALESGLDRECLARLFRGGLGLLVERTHCATLSGEESTAATRATPSPVSAYITIFPARRERTRPSLRSARR